MAVFALLFVFATCIAAQTIPRVICEPSLQAVRTVVQPLVAELWGGGGGVGDGGRAGVDFCVLDSLDARRSGDDGGAADAAERALFVDMAVAEIEVRGWCWRWIFRPPAWIESDEVQAWAAQHAGLQLWLPPAIAANDTAVRKLLAVGARLWHSPPDAAVPSLQPWQPPTPTTREPSSAWLLFYLAVRTAANQTLSVRVVAVDMSNPWIPAQLMADPAARGFAVDDPLAMLPLGMDTPWIADTAYQPDGWPGNYTLWAAWLDAEFLPVLHDEQRPPRLRVRLTTADDNDLPTPTYELAANYAHVLDADSGTLRAYALVPQRS